MKKTPANEKAKVKVTEIENFRYVISAIWSPTRDVLDSKIEDYLVFLENEADWEEAESILEQNHPGIGLLSATLVWHAPGVTSVSKIGENVVIPEPEFSEEEMAEIAKEIISWERDNYRSPEEGGKEDKEDDPEKSPDFGTWHEGLERCPEKDEPGADGVPLEVYQTPGKEAYWMQKFGYVLHMHVGYEYWHPFVRPHLKRIKNECAEHWHHVRTKTGSYRSYWHPQKRVHKRI